MKAVQFAQHGEADVLQLVDLPTPQPQAGQVLIRVKAAGVNYADVMQRRGTYPMPVTLPFVNGQEVAGVVESVGEGVSHLQPGQRVMALTTNGGYAEYALAPAGQTFTMPDALGFPQATALLVQGLTAVGMLRTGDYASVLVLAAAGGVGSMLVQLAKAQGKQVIAAVGNAAKKATVLDLGADVAVSYEEADWVEQVRNATDGQGVSACFDSVGGAVGVAALDTLGVGGTSVVYGGASGEPTMLAGQQLIGQMQVVRGYLLFRDAQNLSAYAGELVELVGAGKLTIPVQTYPFAEVKTAHRDVESRRTQGKVVLEF